jgi:periplasmic protein TonB
MPPGPPGGFGNELGSVLPPKPVGPAVRVIRRSESVQESQLISRVIPTYPQIARVARVSGTVELLVLVGRDGRVLSVEVLSGSPLLAAAAKQAVEQWRYRPAILDGQAVEVQARVTMNFVLDE